MHWWSKGTRNRYTVSLRKEGRRKKKGGRGAYHDKGHPDATLFDMRGDEAHQVALAQVHMGVKRRWERNRVHGGGGGGYRTRRREESGIDEGEAAGLGSVGGSSE